MARVVGLLVLYRVIGTPGAERVGPRVVVAPVVRAG